MLDVTNLLLFGIIFLAALLQTTSGFGFALMAMPLVALVIGVKAAAPLVALVGFTLYAVNLIRYRRGFDWRVLLPLAIAAALGVPLGVWALGNLDEQVVKSVLGVVLIAYALYGVWKPQTAPLRSSLWAYQAGFLAGILGGAFNTPGPPVIIYGNLKQWPRDLFRSTLQALFLFSSSLVIASHAVAGNLTRPVLTTYLLLVPALLLGVWAGAYVDRHMSNERFRILVLALIFATGVLLLI
ncbi:MAG TPA: sulfite exporter TauE/SafE family protein [Anaerolineae bacterium]|nr:sulfite exporter TauE/SafE family protein [Anaerolineae bacterium]